MRSLIRRHGASWLSPLAMAIAAGTCAPAFAQDVQTTPTVDPTQVDEIVVTGTKRLGGVSVQQADIAVTALGPVQLEQSRIQDISDVGNLVPNVILTGATAAPGAANFAVRGMAVYSSIPSSTPAVGIFVDGVYIGVNSGAVTDTFDLAGIEVLRGPQGLLFGRNVTGGALLVRTTEPTLQTTATAQVGVETGPNYTYSGVLSGPLNAAAGLSGKVALYRNDDKGYFTNQFTGNDHFGQSETTVGRLALRWQPNDVFDNVFRYERGKIDGDGPVGQNHRAFSRDSFDVSVGEEGFNHAKWEFGVLESRLNVPFGNGQIVNILGHRSVEQRVLTDVDSAPPVQLHLGVFVDQSQTSDELRYSGRFGRVGVTVGAFYYEDSLLYVEGRTLAAANLAGGGMVDSDSYAVFSSFDIDLSPAWTLTLGARYSEETKTAFVNRIVAVGPANPCVLANRTCSSYSTAQSFPNAAFPDNSESWDAFTPRIALSWEPSDNTNLYASFTRGFRSGGYNLRLTSPIGPGVPGPYDQESTDAYEIGLKQRFFDRRLTANAAVFRNEFKNLQRDVASSDPVLGVLQLSANAADVNVTGAELEIKADLGDRWTIQVNGGYLDGEITKVLYDLSGNGVIGPEDLALDIPFLSPWSYGAAADYQQTTALGQVKARVSYNHRDRAASNDANTGYLNKVDNIDANLSLALPGDNITLSFYGKNLLDRTTFGPETTVPFNYPVVSPFGPATRQTFAPLNKGRVFGFDLRYRY